MCKDAVMARQLGPLSGDSMWLSGLGANPGDACQKEVKGVHVGTVHPGSSHRQELFLEVRKDAAAPFHRPTL